jgi:hypothetical protein
MFNLFDTPMRIGTGFSIAPVKGWDGGIYIFSRSYFVGLGMEGLPASGNINYGNTRFII